MKLTWSLLAITPSLMGSQYLKAAYITNPSAALSRLNRKDIPAVATYDLKHLNEEDIRPSPTKKHCCQRNDYKIMHQWFWVDSKHCIVGRCPQGLHCRANYKTVICVVMTHKSTNSCSLYVRIEASPSEDNSNLTLVYARDEEIAPSLQMSVKCRTQWSLQR